MARALPDAFLNNITQIHSLDQGRFRAAFFVGRKCGDDAHGNAEPKRDAYA